MVIHQGALGDFLLVLPVLNGLHRSGGFVFDLWTRPHHAQLAEGLAFLAAWHSCEGTHLTPFYHDELWEKAPPPPFFRDATTIFFLGQASARPICERLSRRLPCPVHWIQSFPQEGAGRSVADFLAEQFRSLGFPAQNIPVLLQASPQARIELEKKLIGRGLRPDCRPVVLHPGSGGRGKIWPLDKWWNLAQWLVKHTPHPVILILGPADSFLEAPARQMERLGVSLLQDLPLPQVLALLNRGSAYVGNDSGVSHLAAAAGVESVVVFGPTDPRVWAPQGPHVHVVRTSWIEGDSIQLSSAGWEASPDLEAVQNLLLPHISRA